MVLQRVRSVLLSTLILIEAGLCWCSSEHQHCSTDGVAEVKLNTFYKRDITIVPTPQREHAATSQSSGQCRLTIALPKQKNKLYRIFVRGVSVKSVSGDESGNPANLEYSLPSGLTASVKPGITDAFSMAGGTQLSVRSDWDPRTQLRSPVNLRILIPVPGFCSRDMLSFHGNCHTVSQLRHNFTVAMRNMKGDAQLASFISMSQINDFIAANNDRLKVRPWRLALELSEAVRVAVFYNATDGRILSVMKSEGSCELREVERPEEMLTSPVTGPCGSLRVDKQSGRAVMEFGDCRQPRKSLVSFPESEESSSHLGCRLSRFKIAKFEREFAAFSASRLAERWKPTLSTGPRHETSRTSHEQTQPPSTAKSPPGPDPHNSSPRPDTTPTPLVQNTQFPGHGTPESLKLSSSSWSFMQHPTVQICGVIFLALLLAIGFLVMFMQYCRTGRLFPCSRTRYGGGDTQSDAKYDSVVDIQNGQAVVSLVRDAFNV